MAGEGGGPVIQVFGRNDSRETRRAQRFFKERRMPIAFVDLKKRPPAPGELKRFAQKFGARALLDEGSKAYQQANLGYLTMGDQEIIERLIADPKLLRLPLVRFGSALTIGVDEASWKAWQSEV
ncbi:MAG: ArsC/Spx/MgsR family protein [Candidatus Limnocylindrales bacterium]